jgi:hypothetical protein
MLALIIEYTFRTLELAKSAFASPASSAFAIRKQKYIRKKTTWSSI